MEFVYYIPELNEIYITVTGNNVQSVMFGRTGYQIFTVNYLGVL